MRSAHVRAVAPGAGGQAGLAVRAAQRCRGLPAGVGDRELAQVREAELRVRGPGSPRSRAAVPVDPVGGPPQEGRPAARGGRGGEGAPGDRAARGVHGDGGADHRGERGDLRGPPGSGRHRRRGPLRDGRGKGGLWEALAAEKAAEIGRLAGEAARALGCENGLEAAEAVLRAGLLRLGGGVLGEALSADPGYRGPRVDCGRGHEAVFAGYREKVIDTVLGPVTLRRAWYHCAACGHGLAPRDAELGAAGTSMSQGLAAMNDKVAAAGPFAKAAGLLADLAGVHLTAKRAERSAEASGAAKAAADRSRAKAITARRLVPLPPSPLPDKLYAAIDGTGVPVTAKEAAGRDGKGEDGRARTREVKLAFFTQDKVNDEGYPVRDQDSSSYLATFEPASVFAGFVEAEGIRRGARHVRQFTIL